LPALRVQGRHLGPRAAQGLHLPHVRRLLKQRGLIRGQAVAQPAAFDGPVPTIQEVEQAKYPTLLLIDEGNVRGVLLLEDVCREALLDGLTERLERAPALDHLDRLARRRVPSLAL
jgi:hypothetical protein